MWWLIAPDSKGFGQARLLWWMPTAIFQKSTCLAKHSSKLVQYAFSATNSTLKILAPCPNEHLRCPYRLPSKTPSLVVGSHPLVRPTVHRLSNCSYNHNWLDQQLLRLLAYFKQYVLIMCWPWLTIATTATNTRTKGNSRNHYDLWRFHHCSFTCKFCSTWRKPEKAPSCKLCTGWGRKEGRNEGRWSSPKTAQVAVKQETSIATLVSNSIVAIEKLRKSFRKVEWFLAGASASSVSAPRTAVRLRLTFGMAGKVCLRLW